MIVWIINSKKNFNHMFIPTWLLIIGFLLLNGAVVRIESENFKLKKVLKDKGFDVRDYL